MENIVGCVGPMATCTEDLRLFSRVVLESNPWQREPSLIELPWKHRTEVSRVLKIGIMFNDGIVQPHPPVARCLQSTTRQLAEAGHQIVHWNASLHKELIRTANELYFLDGGEEYHETLQEGGESARPLLQWLFHEANATSKSLRETWKVSQLLPSPGASV